MQMKANNHEQTVKQVPNEWGINIPDTIDDACKDFYHVLMVKRVHIPEEETYKTTAKVTQFQRESWETTKNPLKEMLPRLGYKHCFVLHDPSKKVETKTEEKKPAGRPAGRPKKEK